MHKVHGSGYIVIKTSLCSCGAAVALLFAGASVATDELTGLARVLSIEQLEGIIRPEDAGSGPSTTAALHGSAYPAELTLPDGVRIQTRCGEGWCVDGLFINGKELIPAAPDRERAKAFQGSGGKWVRVIRVAWQDSSFLSIYIAESSFTAGAAHAVNAFQCRSFDIKTGRGLSLGDVLPLQSAKLLRTKVRALLHDPELALQELGVRENLRELNAESFDLRSLQDFRFARSPQHGAERPEIVLCAQGTFAGNDSLMLELRVEALPVAYLLR
jgi:hypothetical protein